MSELTDPESMEDFKDVTVGDTVTITHENATGKIVDMIFRPDGTPRRVEIDLEDEEENLVITPQD